MRPEIPLERKGGEIPLVGVRGLGRGENRSEEEAVFVL
jgi:hypothetical protein